MEVAGIVLGSISLVSSVVSPLIVAGAVFISRIRKSQCCGGSIELDKQNQQPSPVNKIVSKDNLKNL
jgi:hypothetical protein